MHTFVFYCSALDTGCAAHKEGPFRRGNIIVKRHMVLMDSAGGNPPVRILAIVFQTV